MSLFDIQNMEKKCANFLKHYIFVSAEFHEKTKRDSYLAKEFPKKSMGVNAFFFSLKVNSTCLKFAKYDFTSVYQNARDDVTSARRPPTADNFQYHQSVDDTNLINT